MRRVLIALHAELDGGLRNMETASGDAFAKQARTALVPAGSAAPPALGGDEKKKSFQTKKESRAETHLDRATRLFSLLACVFRAPFPSAAGVAVPADLVLGAVRRALAADGAGVAAAPGLPATAAPAERSPRCPPRTPRRATRSPRSSRRAAPRNARLAGPVARALDGVLRAGATPALNRGSGSDASGKRAAAAAAAAADPGATCAATRAAAYRVAAAAARARARPRVRRGRARAVRRAARRERRCVRLGIPIPPGIRRRESNTRSRKKISQRRHLSEKAKKKPARFGRRVGSRRRG